MSLSLIQDLSEAFGPSGFEEDVVLAVKKYTEDFDVQVDAMNNVYIALKGNTGKRPVLMLDAHLDEVGFMVQGIDGNGLLSIAALGGWVPSNVPAHTVRVKNCREQFIQGIVTSTPPHFMSEKEKSTALELTSLRVDLGCSSRHELIEHYAVNVGDPVAPVVEFAYNKETDILFGKAFDNRLGCAAAIETLKALSQIRNLPFDVVAALASQEEVGTRGALVTSQVVRPDLAIVFEGSPADDLYFEEARSQCALKKGVQIRHMDSSYVSHRRFIDQARNLAEKEGIAYQSAVRYKGGTNAGRIHTAHKAVPVLVLGIPSRYVHTHYNYAALADFTATVNLAQKLATELVFNNLTMSFA